MNTEQNLKEAIELIKSLTEILEAKGLSYHLTYIDSKVFLNRMERQKNQPDITVDVIGYLNKVTGSNYRTNSKSAIKFIKARVNEGFVLDNFKAVIDSRNSEWKDDEAMKQYLRPETLFGTKFESYLQFACRPQISITVNKMVM